MKTKKPSVEVEADENVDDAYLDIVRRCTPAPRAKVFTIHVDSLLKLEAILDELHGDASSVSRYTLLQKLGEALRLIESLIESWKVKIDG